MTDWSRQGALREQARRKALEDCPPCPACGAPGTYDLLDVTSLDGRYAYVAGYASCTAECWRTDPDRYLAATEPPARPKAPPIPSRNINENWWRPWHKRRPT